MDEQENSQDLTVGLDGAMTEVTKKPTEPVESAPVTAPVAPPAEPRAPSVNTMAPPPQDETVQPPEIPSEKHPSDPSSGVVQAPDEETIQPDAPLPMNETDTVSATDSLSNNSLQTTSAAPSAPSVANNQIGSTSHNSKPARQKSHHDHRNNKKLAVFMTVFVAIALSGAAVFVYVSAQDNATPEQQVIQTPVSSETVPVADEIVEEPIIDQTNDETLTDPDGLTNEEETEPAPETDESNQTLPTNSELQTDTEPVAQ